MARMLPWTSACMPPWQPEAVVILERAHIVRTHDVRASVGTARALRMWLPIGTSFLRRHASFAAREASVSCGSVTENFPQMPRWSSGLNSREIRASHVRRDAAPESEGTCVLYWMQRTQRGVDNPALECGG